MTDFRHAKLKEAAAEAMSSSNLREQTMGMWLMECLLNIEDQCETIRMLRMPQGAEPERA